jgi:DNA replication protein DnaC
MVGGGKEMKVFRTVEEIKKAYGENIEVAEGESVWIIREGQGMKDSVFFLPKPLQKERIAEIMITNNFPEKYIKIALNGVKETEAIRKIREVSKRGVILDGKPGVGKSIASTWKVAKLLQHREVSNPLYLSCVSFPDLKTLYNSYKDYDCFMIDDLIATLPQPRLELIIEILYFAELKERYLFITSNSFTELAKSFPEALLSRLRSYCELHKIKENKDLRLQNTS